MRVLVCPDKFAGTLTATEAAEALAAGWLDVHPGDQVIKLPLADGGPGFLDVVEAAARARALAPRRLTVATRDPLGRPVTASVLVVGERAYVESAQAAGLHLLSPAERDPLHATSWGVGALIATAVETGAAELVIGVGGTATTDAGAGMLAAIGVTGLDEAGFAIPYGAAALLGCAALSGEPRLRGARLIGAVDVDAPLTGPRGAAQIFGPQKGASPADVALLDAALAHLAELLERDIRGCPAGVAARPGAGAGGGLGVAILACGGECVPGIDLVADLVGLSDAVAAADLVITGEGRFDAQSLRGKVVGGVARVARARGVACLVVAGSADVDHGEAGAEGITRVASLTGRVGPRRAFTDPAGELRRLATDVADGVTRDTRE